ncbi:MAG: 4Fe-4S dicluster domain-containing protein [Candidatus Kapabacteria bacterium]|nr:4Fe-4S dicluster domain-containing protein [Candidatus Kapabacteria bacterium]
MSSNNNKFWLSLNNYEDKRSFRKIQKNEFLDGVTDDFNPEKLPEISRRKFLAISAATTAITAVACTDYRDKGEIVPYNKKPETTTIGIANYYSSTCTGCNNHCGILIKTREGRPIKVDGNPDHPVNKGKICAAGQASILNLYDPERLKHPSKNVGWKYQKESWENINKDIIAALDKAKSSNKEIAIISHTINSPSALKLLKEFKEKYPSTVFYPYEYYDNKNKIDAWKNCFGQNTLPAIKLENAKIIVSLDSDFLGNEGNFIENTAKFVSKRNTENLDDFNRLYVVEGGMSLTGLNADYRLRLSPNKQLEFILSLINELILEKKINYSIPSDFAELVKKYPLKQFVDKHKLNSKYVKHLVDDLEQNKGKSIVLAGDKLDYQSQIAVNMLNEIIGANSLYADTDVSLTNEINDFEILKSTNNLPEKTQFEWLINKLNNKKVAVVIHLDCNPVFHLSPDYGYERALKNAELVVTFTKEKTETSDISNYVLAINHDFESWGDFITRKGVYSLQQPVISPLYETRQKEAVLLDWLSGKPNEYKEDIYHKYIMSNWEVNIYPQFNSKAEFKPFWYAALHDGVVQIESNPQNIFVFNSNSLFDIKPKTSTESLSLLLTNNYTIGDGRFANNGWLQELPHPVTKVTWDNYAAISPETAKQLKLKNFCMIELSVGNRNVNLPIVIQPGMADNLICVELGYGRWQVGTVGMSVGVNAGIFIDKTGNKFISDVKIKKIHGNYKIATTQEHHALDDEFVKDMHKKRKIIKEATIEEYKKDKKILHHEHHPDISLVNRKKYTEMKWAMAIDLNKCTGCGACISACNVENNVPIVGKDQVLMGREMHWMRIDRYYSGTPEEPMASNQPMLCQHCDNAPCENVCPVVATNHSPDGLNQMAYNRCVGTRYCSNNCPYKVRRFNFYDFRDHFEKGYYYQDSLKLVQNPEVTVRSRGVMEKCTFCIQRIMEARQEAVKQNRKIKGTDVQTACQVACPASAIIFGDSNDKESEIYKQRHHDLSYYVLEELNIKPNVTYIARLRNIKSED